MNTVNVTNSNSKINIDEGRAKVKVEACMIYAVQAVCSLIELVS